LAFLSRLLEEEGIWYFFDHDDQDHVLRLADDNGAAQPMEGDAALVYRDAAGMTPLDEAITRFTRVRDLSSGKFIQTDYNPLKPSTPLLTESAGAKNTDLAVFEYPGRYEEKDPGGKRAERRMQAIGARLDLGRGASLCPRLQPGRTFTLKKHPVDAFNRDYLVVSVRHRGHQPQVLEEAADDQPRRYDNEFTVIPSDVPYRPERRTPRPVMPGPQTAVVTTPDNEEIYTDEHGRVKVKFHWDRVGENNEKSSCWVRVSQSWAGAGWGALFLPRNGQEVVVSFLDGDPDRPLITGGVYNGAHSPPQSLPKDKNKSTIRSRSTKKGSGGSELTFDDTKGKEKLLLSAQTDLSVSSGANTGRTVGKDDTLSVDGKRTVTIKKALAEDVGEDRTVHVKGGEDKTIDKLKKLTAKAGLEESVTGDRKSTATGHVTHGSGGTMSLDATGELSLSGQSVKADAKGEWSASSMSSLKLAVGGAKIEITPTGVTISSPAATLSVGPTGVSLTGPMVSLNG
jgi:type VI secretion system secreted protein VgrG